MSYLYFAQAGTDGPIKIGITRHDPRKRMVKIQSDCPWPIQLLGAIAGGIEQEARFHADLVAYRTSGEWFRPEPQVLEAVSGALSQSAVLLPPKACRVKRNHPFATFRAERGLTQERFGEMVGVDKVSVHRWESGKRDPQRCHWPAITSSTGITRGAYYTALDEAGQ